MECREYECSVCENRFLTLKGLRQHAYRFHYEKALEMAPFLRKVTQLKTFPCDICHKKFGHRGSVLRHMKIHHIKKCGTHLNKDPIKTTRETKKCPLCEYNGLCMKDTLDHFKNVHEIQFHTSDITFDTFEEFSHWKTEIETTTNTKFIKRISRTNKSGITEKYVCHRSGNYLPSGKGERRIKTQGSSKINGFCPANIQLRSENNKNLKVQYHETHVGHETDVGHLQLTALERQYLAEKIAAKVPFDDILDGIRDSITDSSLKRIHLVTKKDLFNIESSLNLCRSSVPHPNNDVISVESWIIEMQRVGDCVVFYKPQGIVLEEQPQLKEKDFVLIVMNPAQCELLKKYGSDCICVDGTHGTNNYNFRLQTLLVIDDQREVFPCAFLLSNRCDTDVMSLFFNKIKIRAGLISPKIFMSDLIESYFNAWLRVMGAPERRLFCTWHIDRAWRKNLSKIKTKDKQVMMYRTLRTLLQETDPTTFERMLERHCSDMSDPDTIEFIVYFKENYQKNCQHWAYCYRSHLGLNTNMHLERMHRTIKCIYSGGKKIKRLDKGIAALMRFIRNKLIDRLLVNNKGKVSTKIKYIRNRHTNLKDLNPSLIVRTEHGWELPSSTGSETCFIQEVKNSCRCNFTCSECGICIHRYCCTCLDSAVKFNMCKHIHLFAQHRKESGNSDNIATASDDGMDQDSDTDGNDESEVKRTDSIKDRQNEIVEQFQNLISKCTSDGEFDKLEKMVNSVSSTLAAMRSKQKHNNVH